MMILKKMSCLGKLKRVFFRSFLRIKKNPNLLKKRKNVKFQFREFC